MAVGRTRSPRSWRRQAGGYGFGKHSLWEGGVGVGLFMVSGAALLALTLARVPAAVPVQEVPGRVRVRPGLRDLRRHAGEDPHRGVMVGNVVQVDSSVRSINAVVEIDDDKIIIPRNSVVEVNQSGLLMETLIDITPKDPLPAPSLGPLDADCSKEGLILCDREDERTGRGELGCTGWDIYPSGKRHGGNRC